MTFCESSVTVAFTDVNFFGNSAVEELPTPAAEQGRPAFTHFASYSNGKKFGPVVKPEDKKLHITQSKEASSFLSPWQNEMGRH